jgi:hypothetical protein
MSNPEYEPSPDTEIVMLHSDLGKLFLAHADVAAFHQPDDLYEPIEVVLGGTCVSDYSGTETKISIHIRQRHDANGLDYIFIAYEGHKNSWCQIHENGARNIFIGSEKPVSTDDAETMRWFLGEDATQWSSEQSQIYALRNGVYNEANNLSRIPKNNI